MNDIADRPLFGWDGRFHKPAERVKHGLELRIVFAFHRVKAPRHLLVRDHHF
jgi:hypothetical protein